MDRREFIHLTLGGAFLGMSPHLLIDLLGDTIHGCAERPRLLKDIIGELRQVLKVALESGGDYADVYLEDTRRTEIRLSDGKIESVRVEADMGGGVRVVSNWKTGYAFSASWELENLKQAAKVASEISKAGGGDGSQEVNVQPRRGVISYRLSPDEFPTGEKTEIVRFADRCARNVDPAIKQVKVTYRDEFKQVIIVTSEGIGVEQNLPMVWIEVTALAEKEGRRQIGYVRDSKRKGLEYLEECRVRSIAERAAKQAIVMLEAGEAPRGEMPVVINAGGGVVFHEAVGHGLEADGIERGTSFYSGLVGKTVGSEQVTIVDDGSVHGLRGSFDYDDEATPSRMNVLIEQGVLTGYMYDLLTAWKLGAEPTGNGRRQSYAYYPLVRMTNTMILPGEFSPEEAIEETPKGIFAADLGGGEVDIATGDFTFAVREAYLIEDGKITRPLKGVTLIGNGPQILKRIDMVAHDLEFWPGTCGKGQWVPVTCGAPTLRISSITIGGTA